MIKLISNSNFPEDWKVEKLGNISKIIMGQSPGSANYNDEGIGIPLIQGNSDIRNGKSSPRIWTSQITKTCKVGDILLSVRAPVGDIALSVHDACIGRGVCAIRYENRFLYYYLEFFKPRWVKYAQGSTFKAISTNEIKKLEVPYPKIQEQQKIAQILSTWDEAIAKTEKLIAALEQRKKGLLQRLLTGQVRFPGFEEDWISKDLGKYGVCIRGVSYDPKNDLFNQETDESINLLRANNIKEGRINLDVLQFVNQAKVKGNQLLISGDITICIASGSKNLVGKTAIFNNLPNNKYTVGAFCAIYRAEETIYKQYISQLLQSNLYRKKLNSITAGTNIKNLRPSDFVKIKF